MVRRRRECPTKGSVTISEDSILLFLICISVSSISFSVSKLVGIPIIIMAMTTVLLVRVSPKSMSVSHFAVRILIVILEAREPMLTS
jgi:hypothetical protein